MLCASVISVHSNGLQSSRDLFYATSLKCHEMSFTDTSAHVMEAKDILDTSYGTCTMMHHTPYYSPVDINCCLIDNRCLTAQIQCLQ